MRQPAVLWLGVAGAAVAFFYHAPPIKLSYRGFGELAVAITYGPIIASGTYLVQRGTISTDVVLASLPLGIAIAAFLWINELPDARADAAAGKRTLVVQLGQRRARGAFPVILAVAYVGLILLPVAGLPAATLLGAIGLVDGYCSIVHGGKHTRAQLNATLTRLPTEKHLGVILA